MVIAEIGKPGANADCVKLFERMLKLAQEGQITEAAVACVATESSYLTEYCGKNDLELLAPLSMLAHRINSSVE